MNKTYFICLFISLFTIGYLKAQYISGSITDVYGGKIKSANIIIKDSLSSTLIKEFTLAKNGQYSIKPVKAYTKLVLEVSAINHQKESFILDPYDASKNYTHDFILYKDTLLSFPEVEISSKLLPLKLRGDTIIYNVASYKDGTERKIEDIIKKLPGIDVDEKTGSIAYKGKPIETVKLDGDDLFGHRYTIGTKNINVESVDQIEAIDKYSANPLLKDIESTDKVILNLKLKKKNTDYSSSADIGLGLLDNNKMAFDLSSTLLGISSKYKSFATVSFNNIGLEQSMAEYFFDSQSYTQAIREERFRAPIVIPNPIKQSPLNIERTNINRAFLGSHNATFKIGKKINIKSNLSYGFDKKTTLDNQSQFYTFDGQNLTTTDENVLFTKPKQLLGTLVGKYEISSKSSMEYSLEYNRQLMSSDKRNLQNNLYHFVTLSTSKNTFFKQSLVLTNKISPKKALQILFKHTNNSLPEDLEISPSLYDSILYLSSIQNVLTYKKNFLLQGDLLGTFENAKYKISLGGHLNDAKLTSQLSGQDSSRISPFVDFENNTNYSQKSLYASGLCDWTYKKIRVSPALGISIFSQNFFDAIFDKNLIKTDLLLEPNLAASYRLNELSSVHLMYSYKQEPITEGFLYQNPIQLSAWEIQSNAIDLTVQKIKNLTLSYRFDNFPKHYLMMFGMNYTSRRGNYLNKYFILPNSTINHFYFDKISNKSLSVFSKFEKYLVVLQSTVRWTNSFYHFTYNNVINYSDIRENLSKMVSSEFFFKSAWDGILNIENNTKFLWGQSKSSEGQPNDNIVYKSNLKLIFKPTKRFYALISADYILPNSKLKNSYALFLDARANYQTKNKKYFFELSANNILNKRFFTDYLVSDFSATQISTSLLPRNIILKLSYAF